MSAIPVNMLPVYPCVYREHNSFVLDFMLLSGLSLCIQGTQVRVPDVEICDRFIPVYTGNTLIITYCLLIKIAKFKILPTFLLFF